MLTAPQFGTALRNSFAVSAASALLAVGIAFVMAYLIHYTRLPVSYTHLDVYKRQLFLNGMAQPIFPYTTGAVTEGYDNAKSDIIRYCVYVETNYDTDADGKRDLVKALVQIPRAAMEGDYKAATIYEARPYITGCTSGEAPYGKDGYDLDQMYSQPAARKAAGTATTAQAAAQADSSDWY